MLSQRPALYPPYRRPGWPQIAVPGPGSK